MARKLETAFEIDGVPARGVRSFVETHLLGASPVLEITAWFDAYVEIEAMIGHPARLDVGFAGESARTFSGVVDSATIVGSAEIASDSRTYEYVLHVVPRIGLLARSFGSQIFQDLDVKEIVEKVMKDGGIPANASSFRLTGSYPKREYCVQYQESALAFISRLLEEEGIYFFTESGEQGEVVIFADDSTVAAPIDGDATVLVRPRTGLLRDEDAIYRLSQQRRVRSGKYVLRDYNFEKPDLDMTSEATADARADLEVYDYPGHYADPAQGKRRAQVRLEAEQALRSTVSIEGVCARICAGRKLKIDGAGSADGEYVVTGTVHALSADGSGRAGDTYSTKATLLPAAVKFRTALSTPLPLIEGPQTARIVAPAGSPSETIHTDKHGRCKVKFHWDLAEAEDDKASCWMRVEQLQTSGSMILPRVDWEVIVEFLEGNPDRPIVAGRLFNGVFMPPYALPEGKTRTVLKSTSSPGGGGMNEIRIEDKAGSEEVMIHAQKNSKTVAANKAKKSVGNNDTSVVGASSSLAIAGNQDVKVTKGCENTISGGQTVSVGGNRTVAVNAVTGLTVGGSATTSVGGNQMEMDGNPIEGLLALAAQKAVAFAEAKAGAAIARIQGEIQGAVDQVMGPVNKLAGQAQALGDQMKAVASGDLSAAGGLVAGASGIPGADELASSLGGGGGESASRGGGTAAKGGGEDAGGGMATKGGAPAGGMAAKGGASAAVAGEGGGGGRGPDVGGVNAGIADGGSAVRAAASSAIKSGVGAAKSALGAALGLDSAGGGGSSMANAGGPEGDVAGVDATDREKGPGHSTAKVAGAYSEAIGAIKVLGVLDGVNTSVAGSMTQHVGAAHVELVIGNRSEAIGASKTEKAVGLVVLSKGGESEQVAGAKSTMVGGAIIDKIKGSHMVQAGGTATFVGAFHKVEASKKITFKCGGSTVVIDGGGITITAPIVTIFAGKIQLPMKVTEV
ncbi:MAG: type VI secretion system tip protein TssI/VgrG [Byssovorax sp.]